MVIKEIKEINGKQYTYHYSDKGFYIERDGVKYSSAIDPLESTREYTETDELIEQDAFMDEERKERYKERFK